MTGRNGPHIQTCGAADGERHGFGFSLTDGFRSLSPSLGAVKEFVGKLMSQYRELLRRMQIRNHGDLTALGCSERPPWDITILQLDSLSSYQLFKAANFLSRLAGDRGKLGEVASLRLRRVKDVNYLEAAKNTAIVLILTGTVVPRTLLTVL